MYFLDGAKEASVEHDGAKNNLPLEEVWEAEGANMQHEAIKPTHGFKEF